MSKMREYVHNIEPTVICDTDIWYKGKTKDVRDKHVLVATWLSVYELFKASNRTEGVLINVWDRLKNDASYIIPLWPDQHFFFYYDRGEIRNAEILEMQRKAANEYDLILKEKQAGNLTEDQWKQFESNSTALRNNYRSKVKLWVEQIESTKKSVKTDDEKKVFLNSEEGMNHHLRNVTMPYLLWLFTGDVHENGDSIDPNDFSKFELFIAVFNHWLIDLDLGRETATVNDLIDVFNMIYVTPVDKYWIEEPKWVEKIKKVGMEHYLFDPKV